MHTLSLNSNITYVRIKINSLIGCIKDKIYIFNINTLETIEIINIDNTYNPILGISNIINNSLIIAFPLYNNKGKIQIEKFLILNKYNKKEKTMIINAHESNITFIAINNEGTLLASGSEKGSYIKIFYILNGDLLAELKKGKKSKIEYISFESKSEIIGYISSIGKVYIYDINEIKTNIKNSDEKDTVKEGKTNIKHETHIIKKKPFGKFKIKDKRNIIGFIQPKSFVILTLEGKLYKLSYNKEFKPKCSIIEESFIKI